MSATFRIVYPENRIVSAEWVLSQGLDAKVNSAVNDYVKANGELCEEPTGAEYETFVAGIAAPDLYESIEILEDLGLVTFAKWTSEDDRAEPAELDGVELK